MIKVLDILLCSGVVMFEIVAAFIFAALIQLIMYQVFGINLYKLIIKSSMKLDRYLSEKFEGGE